MKTNIGIIGCGNISGNYLTNAKKYEVLNITACADLFRDKAEAIAAKYGIPKVCTVEELLADPSVEIILNLTTPDSHALIAKQALLAGKSVYNEKPLTISREEGEEILKIARERGLRIGCAPDTFLGAGYQTCRKLIEDGEIGTPIAAAAFFMNHGHESWHPNPEFYYQKGGGPMLDMGPYYLTALVSLLGPVKRITGSTKTTFLERYYTRDGNKKTIKVETPTHIVGTLDFQNGATAIIITSFDIWAHHFPYIEIYGTEGSISAPDPNGFEGSVKIWKPSTKEWQEVPLLPTRAQSGRSIGLADMALGIHQGRPHRANGDLAFHVLDIMHTIHDASDKNTHIFLSSTCNQPEPLFKDF